MCVYFRKKWYFQLCCFSILFLWTRYTDSAPTTSEGSEFVDDWDYNVIPHSVPFLNISKYEHKLPPTAHKISANQIYKYVDETQRDARKMGDAVKSSVSCSICNLGVALLQTEIKKNTPFEEIKKKFVSLCVGFKIQIESVCSGIFDVFGPEVIHVLKRLKIGPPEICSMIFGESCGEVENPLHEWSIDIPGPKPKFVEPDLPKKGLPTFKVLHVSDTHYDPQYVPGTVVNCQEPLCCRQGSTPPEDEDVITAGKWGSYKRCDAPRALIMNMLTHISEQHPDIDYIMWTGDLPPHDVWNETKDAVTDIIRDTTDQMFEVFPNVPIFPVLGNHESLPPGNFPPPWVPDEDHNIYWLYSQIADHWRRWLPATTGNTVLHGGFYSILLRPGFRLISLNTNYCHTFSWWLMLNSTDPANELKWLIHELQEAENKGEKVHLIGHVPPGNEDCMKVWSRNFYKIVDRYEGTIVAQFYGHTHSDEFEVFYDVKELSRPTNVAYLGPSVTTYENHNPAYRIYYVDGDHDKTTREVLDHETWTTDLQAANENGMEPVWYRLYSAKEAYGLSSLRPTEWAKLIERMVTDENLFRLFYKHYYRDSPASPSCNTPECKLQILCDLKAGRSQDRHHLCHDLELAFGS